MIGQGERPPQPEGIEFSPRIPFDELWALVEVCWAQMPDRRPTGSEIQIAILNLQRGSTTDSVTNNSRSSAIAEDQVMAGGRDAYQDCDKTPITIPLLHAHIKTHRMDTCECSMAGVLDSS
jgi:hypothetical protein